MSRERLRLQARPRGARLIAHGTEAVRGHLLERARREGELAGQAAAGEVLDLAVERMQAEAEELRAVVAGTATELAVEIVRTLLRTELPAGRYDLERIVRETLGASGVGRNPCVVHLNPVDHARLKEVRFRSGTRIEADEGVPRGDVHVETSLGLMVRDLEGALETIAQRLREELA